MQLHADLGYASVRVHWPIVEWACAQNKSGLPQNTSGLKDLQHRLFGKILAALSVRGGWLLPEWLDPGDAAVVLYGNERNCTHLHDTLTRIGYTEERFVELLEGYGTLHTQPVMSKISDWSPFKCVASARPCRSRLVASDHLL